MFVCKLTWCASLMVTGMLVILPHASSQEKKNQPSKKVEAQKPAVAKKEIQKAEAAKKQALKAYHESIKKARGNLDKANQAFRDALKEAREKLLKASDAYRKALAKRSVALRKKTIKAKPRPKTKGDSAVDKAREGISQANKNWFQAIKKRNDFRREKRKFLDDPKVKKQLEELEKAIPQAREGITKAIDRYQETVRARNEARRKEFKERTSGKREKKKGSSD